MSVQCLICGKICKSVDGVRQHQLMSDSCRPSVGARESHTVKQLHEKLERLVKEGKELGLGSGSFEQSEANAREQREVEAALRAARSDSKAEAKAIRKQAAASMSAASWTQSILEGDARFARAEESIDSRLAQETVGLVSGKDFAAKRVTLEHEQAQKRVRDAEAEAEAERERRERKERRKAKQEKRERRGLSFHEEDGE